MPRGPRIQGGEYTLLIGAEGQEKKLNAYPTLPKARANARLALGGGYATRVVIVRPSGAIDVADFREVIETSG